MGTGTVSINGDSHTSGLGNLLTHVGILNLSSSYANGGGDTVTPNALGLAQVISCIIAPADGYFFEYDIANEKVIAYESGADGSANDEATNAVDLSGINAHFIAVGR